MRAGLAAAVIVSLATVTLGANEAGAYCRSTTCDGIDACNGEEIPGCPTLLWESRCVGFNISEVGGPGLDAGTVELITELAFDQWRKADCGDGGPGVVIQNLGHVACNAVEYNKDAGNANIVLFNTEWPHSEATHTYALTTTTFDPETGVLLNADIELNARDHTFTVNDEQIEADLLSVLTHETGHFLGLAHSEITEATMFAFYDEGTSELRSLDADDVAAICDAYPTGQGPADTCNPLPKHGFSPDCRDDQKEGDCAVSAVGAGSSRGLSIVGLAVAALSLRARSGARRRSTNRSA